jgi:hypothetical protein
MKHAAKKQNNKRHPLFGRVEADADLGIAMLIAETEDGQYEPNGPVATINEAIDCAQHDMASRIRDGFLYRAHRHAAQPGVGPLRDSRHPAAACAI